VVKSSAAGYIRQALRQRSVGPILVVSAGECAMAGFCRCANGRAIGVYAVLVVERSVKRLILAALLLLWPIVAGASVTIAPNNAAIRYSPGSWSVTSRSAQFMNGGAYFSVLLTGTRGITINWYRGAPGVSWRVDGASGPGWTPPASVSGSTSLTVPTTTWTTHMLEVVFTRSNGDGGWGITSITIDDGGAAVAPKSAGGLNVICFGDSITDGEVSTPDGGGDARNSWCWQQTYLLGINVGNIGNGGQGWSTTQAPLSATWRYVYGSVPRDISNVDLIEINEGQNDAVDVTTACISTVNAMLAVGKATMRVVLLQPFSGYHASDLQACASGVSSPGRVSYLSTTGFERSGYVHPPYWDEIGYIGPQIATKVRTIIDTYNLGRR
jgi:hypothetical protein